jgi:hypothetical protein
MSHNRENPYVMLNKRALWDPNLSLKAVGMWARCLSLPDNWQFSLSEFGQKCHEGKDAIRSVMRELVEFGYVMRVEHREVVDGKYAGGFLEYIFFESRATPEQKNAEMIAIQERYPTHKIKELELAFRSEKHRQKPISPETENHKPENPLSANPPLLNTEDSKYSKSSFLKKDRDKEKKNSLKVLAPPIVHNSEKGGKPPVTAKAVDDDLSNSHRNGGRRKDFSSEIVSLAFDMIEALKRSNEEFRAPRNLDAIMTQIDFMIRLDKRDPAKVLDVFLWALSDSFWKAKMYKPNPAKYLREKFDQLYMQSITKYVSPYERTIDRRTKNPDGTPMDIPEYDNLF